MKEITTVELDRLQQRLDNVQFVVMPYDGIIKGYPKYGISEESYMALQELLYLAFPLNRILGRGPKVVTEPTPPAPTEPEALPDDTQLEFLNLVEGALRVGRAAFIRLYGHPTKPSSAFNELKMLSEALIAIVEKKGDA